MRSCIPTQSTISGQKVVKRQFWIQDAEPDDQGSFCDRGSGYHYDNANGLQTRIAADRADERDEFVYYDDWDSDDVSFSLDRRFNCITTEQDDHNLLIPAKHTVEPRES